MAKRLVEAGYEVVAYDLNPEALARAEAAGCRRAASAVECATGAEMLMTSLPRPDHVQSVMVDGGVLAALEPGSIWVDLTTNRKEFVADLTSVLDGLSHQEARVHPTGGAIVGDHAAPTAITVDLLFGADREVGLPRCQRTDFRRRRIGLRPDVQHIVEPYGQDRPPKSGIHGKRHRLRVVGLGR